jgi:hypothetical protein
MAPTLVDLAVALLDGEHLEAVVDIQVVVPNLLQAIPAAEFPVEEEEVTIQGYW